MYVSLSKVVQNNTIQVKSKYQIFQELISSSSDDAEKDQ